MAKQDEEHIQIITLADKSIVSTITKIEPTRHDYDPEADKTSAIIAMVCGSFIMFIWLLTGGLRELLLRHPFVIPIAVVGTILSGLGFLLWHLTSKENNELKIVAVGKRGISLGRFGTSAFFGGGYKIDWTRVKCLDMQVTGKQRYLLIETTLKIVYKIKWENAFDWVSESEFLDKVKTYSSNTILNLPRSKSNIDKDDPRYTQLWLEYFSNPNTRKRKSDLEVGDTLDNGSYKIVERRAQGGQGRVYLATKAGKQVILKEYILPVNQGTSIEKDEANSLAHEVKILSSIDNPGIVKVHDCLIEDHRGYIVLEYVKGYSLRELVREKGAVPQEKVLEWTYQIAEILNYLHTKSPPIVHRDLTPDNLMLDENGKIKLIDFTIAQQSKGGRLNAAAGKHAYMPPEQIKGEVHPGNDYYALGCTMYFLLTGVDPLPLAVKFSNDQNSDISEELIKLVSYLSKLKLSDRLTDHKILLGAIQAIS